VAGGPLAEIDDQEDGNTNKEEDTNGCGGEKEVVRRGQREGLERKEERENREVNTNADPDPIRDSSAASDIAWSRGI